jgi:flagellar hook assembly protein FlgD
MTRIGFELGLKTQVDIAIYNIYGQKIRSLVDGIAEPGRHEVLWSGRSDSGEPVSSGLYICKIQTEKQVETRKMVLIR